MFRLFVSGVIGLLTAAGGPLLAADFGTAGPFRSVGGVSCQRPVVEQLGGACDPPIVDPSLPAPDGAIMEVERARILIGLMRVDAAKAALSRAVALDPNNADAIEWRARLAMTLGDPVRARADIDAALMLRPRSPSLLASRAYLMNDSLQDALAVVDQAIALDPGSPDAFWIRSRIRLRLEDFARSESDLSSAIKLDPSKRFYQDRAELRLRLGRFSDAMADTDEVIRISPRDLMALVARSEALAGLGDDRAALDELTSILDSLDPTQTGMRRNPVFKQVALWRAMLLTRLGRGAEVTPTIDQLLSGGTRAVLQVQVFLRQNGFTDLAIDGVRSQAVEDALRGCFANRFCGLALAKRA